MQVCERSLAGQPRVSEGDRGRQFLSIVAVPRMTLILGPREQGENQLVSCRDGGEDFPESCLCLSAPPLQPPCKKNMHQCSFPGLAVRRSDANVLASLVPTDRILVQ